MLCNLTVRLHPAIQLERTFGSAVSVLQLLRQPALLRRHRQRLPPLLLGPRAMRPHQPDRTGSDCGFSPYQPRAAIALLNYTASIGSSRGGTECPTARPPTSRSWSRTKATSAPPSRWSGAGLQREAVGRLVASLRAPFPAPVHPNLRRTLQPLRRAHVSERPRQVGAQLDLRSP